MGNQKTYSNIIRYFITAGLLWSVSGIFLGFINQLQLFLYLPSPSSYGLIRPLSTTHLIFGAFPSFFIGGVYYILSVIENRTLKCEKGAMAGFILHQMAILISTVALLSGFNKGREFGEMTWLGDNLLTVSLILFLAVLVRNYGKDKLTVTGRFAILTVTGAIVIFILGNWSSPYSLLGSAITTQGLKDLSVQEFYRFGIYAYFLVLPGFTLAYGFIPHYYKVNLYSEELSNFHAVTSVVLVPFAGAAYLIYTLAPTWSAALGIVAVMLFAVSVLAGVMNLHYTLSKSGSSFHNDALGDSVRFGLFILLISAVHKGLFSFRFLQEKFNYGYWNPQDLSGDVIIWAFPLFIAIALVAFQSVQNYSFSSSAKASYFWLAIIGAGIILVADLLSGIGQSAVLSNLDKDAVPVHPEWISVMIPWSMNPDGGYAARYLLSFRGLHFIGYLCVFASVLTVAFNMISTLNSGKDDSYTEPALNSGEK